MRLPAFAHDRRVWVAAGAAIGVGAIADRLSSGQRFRAVLKSVYLSEEMPDVCMCVKSLGRVNGRVVTIFAVIDDPRVRGNELVEYEVLPEQVIAVAPKGQACAPLASFGWRELPADGYVMLRRGLWYRGLVAIPFPVPRGLVLPQIVPALEAKGFEHVSIEEDPAGLDGDLLVEAQWARDDKEEPRPSAVVRAWRQA